jgi:hypothetical protein
MRIAHVIGRIWHFAVRLGAINEMFWMILLWQQRAIVLAQLVRPTLSILA